MELRTKIIQTTSGYWLNMSESLSRRTTLTISVSILLLLFVSFYIFLLGKVPINDEALIDDLMMILKKEVASQRNKNVDILNISSLICHKLSGKLATTFRRL